MCPIAMVTDVSLLLPSRSSLILESRVILRHCVNESNLCIHMSAPANDQTVNCLCTVFVITSLKHECGSSSISHNHEGLLQAGEGQELVTVTLKLGVAYSHMRFH